jgi:hypothetical protein
MTNTINNKKQEKTNSIFVQETEEQEQEQRQEERQLPDENFWKRYVHPQEENIANFRYKDFTEKARIKIAKLLKKDSTLNTIRRMSIESINTTLNTINPPIIETNSIQRIFNFGQFPRYKEIELSRLIYYASRRKITNSIISFIVQKVKLNEWISTSLSNKYATTETQAKTTEENFYYKHPKGTTTN